MPEPNLSLLERISLKNLDGGAVEQEFQEVMTEVVEAISDPERQGPCTVTLTLTFKPGKRKGFVESTVAVSKKIPNKKRANILMVRDGRIVQDVTSCDASQPGLFPRNEQHEEARRNEH